MARVNLERRAAIGEAKRARTRAAILEAARACYAAPEPVSATVDAVTQAAGVAKGTFYLHFRDLPALEAELGETLIAELSERLEPARLAVENPLTRMATAVTILLRDLAAAPAQARLAARAAVMLPDVAQAVQARLRGDLADAQAAGLLAVGSVDLAVRIVVALVEQASSLFSTSRIDATSIPDIVRAVLRAMGCPPGDAANRTDEAALNADAFAQRTTAAAGAAS
ncbi:MAG: TetR/AcrR family transcriptional regulator [Rhizobium leguminosarum]